MKASNQIQYIHDRAGNPTAAIVPMKIWREYELLKQAVGTKKGKQRDESETEYIMRSKVMVEKIEKAKEPKKRYTLEEALGKIGVNEAGKKA